MSWLPETILGFHNWYNGVHKHKTAIVKNSDPLRIGVLGAAKINITAIIDPVSTHPGAVLAGIAARDVKKAQEQIDRHHLSHHAKAYGSYQELLNDPNIDAVYIPLPNGLHAEWAIKALQAGKHVLLEKPFTSNAEQARRVAEAAHKADKICLEAFHWRFHPAAHLVKSIVQGGKYGDVVKISSNLVLPRGIEGKDNIRFKYSLAGGATMDLTYVLSSSSFFAAPGFTDDGVKFQVNAATARLNAKDKLVDNAMRTHITIEVPGKKDVQCYTEADLELRPLFGFIPRLDRLTPDMTIECEHARIQYDNFVAPWFNHSITITEKSPNGTFTGKKHIEKCYKDGPQWSSRGQDWWTTYRYQLESFVDQVNAKETGEEYRGPNMEVEESIKLMTLIDAVYDKSGLPRRGL